jgi:hypothetical protein
MYANLWIWSEIASISIIIYNDYYYYIIEWIEYAKQQKLILMLCIQNNNLKIFKDIYCNWSGGNLNDSLILTYLCKVILSS